MMLSKVRTARTPGGRKEGEERGECQGEKGDRDDTKSLPKPVGFRLSEL
jgi:hypothetical protein